MARVWFRWFRCGYCSWWNAQPYFHQTWCLWRSTSVQPLGQCVFNPPWAQSKVNGSIIVTSSSSSSLACPVIWGRRYSWWSYSSMLPCLSCCPLETHLCHVSLACHRRFGRPLLLFPGMSTSNILLTMCSTFILLTWPYHFSRFSVIFLHSCTTLVVPLMCSFRIVSLLVTPHIHICILISFTSSRASCPLVVAQVSAPYNRAGLTTVL